MVNNSFVTLSKLCASAALVALGTTVVLQVTSGPPATAAASTIVSTAGSSVSPTAYVANELNNSVTPIDLATNTAGSPIEVGANPAAIAITPDGSTAYVANVNSNSVTPIDTATNTVGSPIEVGANPAAIAITPDGSTAYVANQNDNTVTPIDLATNTAGSPIAVGNTPVGVAITPNGSTAYVANQNDNTVTPIDLATNTAGGPIAVGRIPVAIAITPNGSFAYVVDSSPASVAGITVTPINTATNTAANPIPLGTGAGGPINIAITADGSTAYVTNEEANSVIPINLATNTAGNPIAVDSPRGIAITPDGSTAYVTNTGVNFTVTPIDLATNTAGSPIAVGAVPIAVAITPDQAPVANLSVTPAPAGQPTSFDASASTVASGTITSYFWQFGDCVWLCTATTTTPTTTHTYGEPGTYTATVSETDSAGTSRKQVFTGQTVSRNGGPSAVASQTFAVAGPAPPTIVPGTASVIEPSSGTTTLEVPVTLSAPSTNTVTAQWSTLDVSGAPCCQANPATDYVPASGTVTFAPGETSASVPIAINGGQSISSNEYIVVSFNNPTNANMGGFWGLGFGGIDTASG